MKNFPSCHCVGTTIWLYHLDFKEMSGEKARCALHKDATCCFEQILEAASYKTATVQPLTSHLTNHPSKTSKTYCWKSKHGLISNDLLFTFTHAHTSVDWAANTYSNQLCAGTGYDLERWLIRMDGKREREREGESR